MRAFIAIDFRDDIKKDILAVQQFIRGHALAGRWKQVNNFHLTLKFLGEITPGAADRVCAFMDDVASRHSSFELSLGQIGFFKGHGVLRVVWLGIEGDKDALYELQRDIDSSLVSVDFKSDNRFSPHITLGQDVKLDMPFEDLREAVSPAKCAIGVHAFYLMDSRVVEGRRIYTPIKQFPLARR